MVRVNITNNLSTAMKNSSLKKPPPFQDVHHHAGLPKNVIPMDDLDVDDLGFSVTSGPLPIRHQNADHVLMAEVTEDLDGLTLNNQINNATTVGLEDFQVLKLVGQGGFGKVYQVRKMGSSEIFAMKVIRKDRVMKLDHAEFVKAEKEILAKLDHPFIVRLRYSFHTKYRLYLVLDYVNGGELYFHLKKQGLFLEDLARFYAAEIVSAVSHLHANGIMHRDIKSVNILLDSEGHIVLTDFGLAKQFDDTNPGSDTFCGTTEFMAPEIVLGRNHDRTADWWSVGILLYEMLTGNVPFKGSRREVLEKIVKGKIRWPSFLTSEANSLLKGLLTRDPSKRLGRRGGSEDIRRHKWFSSINWKKLEAREIRPSFVPKVAGKQCTANFRECFSLTNISVVESPANSPRCSAEENPFQGFNYVRPIAG